MRVRASEALAGPIDHLPLSELTRFVVRGCLPGLYLEPDEEITEPEPLLYFVQDQRRAIRIGVSGTLRYRLPALQKAHRAPLWLLTAVPGTEAIERSLVRHFGPTQIRGNWFGPTPELLQLIIDLKTIMYKFDARVVDDPLPAGYLASVHQVG